MSGESQREMTLDEWVERLPEIHSARKEYAALKAMVEKLTAHNTTKNKIKPCSNKECDFHISTNCEAFTEDVFEHIKDRCTSYRA